jgi:hypothetical protein
MSSVGAAPRAAVPVTNARVEASRKNGAKSRGPKTEEGKARSARNALKHGLRAQKFVVLPHEDAAEFAGLEAAMVAELAPVGALQVVLARRIAVAAWRLARADRMEAEVFAERGYDGAGPGRALIRDGNGTRSFETLLRYRGAALAEFIRSLRILKALQAEQAAGGMEAAPSRPAARVAHRRGPNEPTTGAADRLDYVVLDPPLRGRTLHETPAPLLPNSHATEPQPVMGASEPGCRTNPAPPRSAAPTSPRPCPSAASPPSGGDGRGSELRKLWPNV